MLGIFLMAVGLYGVVSYLVSRRSHEIAIRIALGARGSEVLSLVLGGSLKLALVAIPIGLAGSFLIGKLLSSSLYDDTSFDPLPMLSSIGVTLLVICLATLKPARRAMRVDPAMALRPE